MLEELLELLNTKRDAGELNLKDFSFSSQNCLPIEANINRNLLFFRKLSKIIFTKASNLKILEDTKVILRKT